MHAAASVDRPFAYMTPNFNNKTLYILSLVLMFLDKSFLHEFEA